MEERIDKWLWAMRVYKTRTIAAEEIKKGRVSIGLGDGVTAKPSRTVKVGDIVHVRKSPIQYTFRVKALSNNRLGAKLVPEYLENLTPQSQYDLLDVVRISGFVDRRKGLGRPTKREGRELARFADQASGGDWFLDWDDDIDVENDSAAQLPESNSSGNNRMSVNDDNFYIPEIDD